MAVTLASPESHSWMVTILRGGRCRWVRRAFFRWWKSPSVRVYLCRRTCPSLHSPPPCRIPQPTRHCPVPTLPTLLGLRGRGTCRHSAKASKARRAQWWWPPSVPLPAALVLRLPALLKQGRLVEGHATTRRAGGQEALGLGVLALGVLPPQFGVCEESQERVGRAWCRQSWAGPAREGARGAPD